MNDRREMSRNRYRIHVTPFPFVKDLNEGGTVFIRPRFQFDRLKGTPCVTEWLYDWILQMGYLSVYRRSDYELFRFRNRAQ